MQGRHFNSKVKRIKYIVIDYVSTFIAFLVFDVYRYFALHINQHSFPTVMDFICSPKIMVEQFCVPFLLLGVYWLSGYYNNPISKSRLVELTTTLYSAIISTTILYFAFLINDSTGFKSRDYELILVLLFLFFGIVYLGRWILTTNTIYQLKSRQWNYSTLIIGNSKKSREVYKELHNGGSVWAYDVVGFIRLEREHQVEDAMNIWDWSDVEVVCNKYNVDQIILAPEKMGDASIMNILNRLFPLDIPVKIAPDTLSYVTSNIRMNDILGVPFIDLTSPAISECEKNIKRIFDVIASSLTLVVLSPFLLIIWMIVRLTSKGDVIYKQERIGKSRKPFFIYKFRSMYENAESNGPQLSSDEDTRITPFGKFMRKYRIDELPQFWNVLKGDMSIVGPRPERDFFIEKIMKKAPYYGLIFQVRPGITSWGMVKYGYASDISEMVSRSKYDLIYLNNMSLTNDVKIMIYTIRTVLKGSGK